VTNANDGGPGSLRQAIGDATSGDTINFNIPASDPNCNSTTNVCTVKLTSGELKIDKNLTIEGTGALRLTVQRKSDTNTDPKFRIFNIAAGVTVSISGLTLSNGSNSISGENGGGIFNNGSLTLSDCVLTNNRAGQGTGGAIHNKGTLTINHCTILNNVAFDASGGGIFNEGDLLTINDSNISGNSAQLGAPGGGIFNRRGRLIIKSSTLSGNRCAGDGGGAIRSLSSEVEITDSTVSNNIADGEGGGIHVSGGKVTISNSTFINNNSGFGGSGGIRIANATDTSEIFNSSIISNKSINGVGGLEVANAPVRITGSTIARNRSSDDAGGINLTSGSLEINQCTVSNNVGGEGSAILISGGALSIKASTVVSNTSNFPNAGALHIRGGSVHINSSVIAINKTFSGAAIDIKGAVTSDGFNLIGSSNGAIIGGNRTGDRTDLDPLLGPLQNNGGPTLTHAPLPGSPVINNGDSSLPRTIDQRGFPRPAGGPPDIGAFEIQPINISGFVHDGDGNGIGGVTLTLSGKRTFVTKTDAGGVYSFGACADLRDPLCVPPGGKFTLTSSKVNFDFVSDDGPTFASFENLVESQGGVNFTGTPLSNPTPPPDPSEGFDGATSDVFNKGLLSQDPAAFNPETSVVQAQSKLMITPPIVKKDDKGRVLEDGTFDGDSFSGYVARHELDMNLTTSVSVKVEQPLVGDGAQTAFAVGSDEDNFFGLHVAETAATQQGVAASARAESDSSTVRNLFFDIVLGGRKFQTGSVPYEPSKHVHWRIRFDAPAAEVIFETSQNGTGWAAPCTPASSCRFKVNIGSTEVASQLLAGTVKRIDDPGTAVFDDYKVAEQTGIHFEGTQSLVVQEGGTAGFSISRTGDVDSPASVDFTITDISQEGSGRAAGNSIASGTFLLGEQEAQKTFPVTIPDDGVNNADRRMRLTLSNPLGGALADNRSFDFTISNNPLIDPTFFVSQQYCDFLARRADESGRAFWSSNITHCGNDASCIARERVRVSGAFFVSIEFQETGFLVYLANKAAYGDIPGKPVPITFSQFQSEMPQISGGVQVNVGNWKERLEANKTAYFQRLADSQRFKDVYGNLKSTEYIDALFARAGVTPSAEEKVSLLLILLTQEATGRAVVLRKVAEHPKFHDIEFNKAFVLMEYFGYLHRNPDDAPETNRNFDGYNFWLSKLNQFGGDPVASEMIRSFIVSDEYKKRFAGAQVALCEAP
jgi:hypothetical protein